MEIMMNRLMVALMAMSMVVQINAADAGAARRSSTVAPRCQAPSRRACICTAVIAALAGVLAGTAGAGLWAKSDTVTMCPALTERVLKLETDLAWCTSERKICMQQVRAARDCTKELTSHKRGLDACQHDGAHALWDCLADPTTCGPRLLKKYWQ